MSGEKEIYCLVPFGQMSTKPNGSLRPCCASGDKIPLKSQDKSRILNLNQDRLPEAWNSNEMLILREKFLNGESDPGCSECTLNESLGKKSTRQWKNESWSELTRLNIEEAKNENYKIITRGPVSLELRLGNLCNLNCRMCNPIFSSRWKGDLEKDEGWKESNLMSNLFSSSLETSQKQGSWYQTKEFWDDVLSYAKDLRSIYLSGGEPLIIEELTPFLEQLSEINPNIKIRLDTNLMQFPEKTFELLSRFKEVALGASVDAIGTALEFIRNGSSEKVIVDNLRKIVAQGSVFNVNLSVTYMALNALELYELFSFIKGEQFEGRVSVNIDILYEPSCLSVRCLPREAQGQAQLDIKTIVSDLNEKLSLEEKRNLDSIHTYLETCEQGDTGSLIEYNKWLDGIQGKNLKEYLPKLHRYLSEWSKKDRK